MYTQTARHGDNPKVEYFSIPCDSNIETIPKVIAKECAEPGVSFLTATTAGDSRVTLLVFARRIKYPGQVNMTIHDIIKCLKEVGRDDLAEAITPPQHSGHLRTAREIAVLLAQIHDRAMGEEVDFSLRGQREYGTKS